MSFPPVSGMTVKSGHTKIQIIKFLIQHLVVLLKTEAVGQTGRPILNGVVSLFCHVHELVIH